MRLKATDRFTIYKVAEGKVPEALIDFPQYLRKLVIWIEKLYSDIAEKVNWLIGLDPIKVTTDYTAKERRLILIDASANAVNVTFISTSPLI